MTKPKVTVTLGRSGQVVRRDHFDGGCDAQFVSGGGQPQPSIRDRLGNNGENSFYSGGKWQRGVGDALRPDKQIGKNDLRLKLLHKKRSLQLQRDTKELRNKDLREKLQRNARPSRTVRVMPLQKSLPTVSIIGRQRSPPRVIDNVRFVESSNRSYSSWGLEEKRPSSPERIARPTQGISPPRVSNHTREVPAVRSTNASRSVQVRGNDALLNYRPAGSASQPFRAVPELMQPVRPHASSSSIIRPSPYMVEEPSTVSGLLQSIGLSKYCINFQAEEVDFLTLKQMGDIDLKEMGIPMGPRKKILLAIKSRSFRRPP